MSLGTENGTQLTMPVMPAYGGVSNNSGGGFGGFGGDGAWWLIVLFLFVFCGWGNGGWGGNGNNAGTQGAITRTDLCSEFSFQELQNGVRNVNDAVSLGFANLNSTICHQQYDTAMQTNAIQAAVNGGFQALNSTICQQQYDTAQQINGLNNTINGGFNAMNISNLQTANAQNIAQLQSTNAIQNQISDCCCKTQSGMENIKFTIAQEDCNTRNLMQSIARDQIDNANANTRAIIDKLNQQEIEAKNAQITALNQRLFAADLAASQSAQNAYLINTLRPTPVPAYPASSPCGYNWSPSVLAGYGYNNGCGCNC